MTPSLSALRKLCDEATPGDVRVELVHRDVVHDPEPIRSALVIPTPGNDPEALSVIGYGFTRPEDAEYYASVQPSVVRDLIDEIERLQQEVERLKAFEEIILESGRTSFLVDKHGQPDCRKCFRKTNRAYNDGRAELTCWNCGRSGPIDANDLVAKEPSKAFIDLPERVI